MIAYHGSNARFNRLRIHESLVNSPASRLTEGMGIYFSCDCEVAMSYGRYLYTLEINDTCLADFRNRDTCINYVVQLRDFIINRFNIDIAYYINIEMVVDYVLSGSVAVSNIWEEVQLLLDSNEEWHRLNWELADGVFETIKKFNNRSLQAYIFPYNIKDVGIIKDVSNDVVRIVNAEQIR